MTNKEIDRRTFLRLALKAVAAGLAVSCVPVELDARKKEKEGNELFFLPVDLGPTLTPEVTLEYQTLIENQGKQIDWQGLAQQSLVAAAVNPERASYSVFAYRLRSDGVLVRDQGADVVKKDVSQDNGWTPDQQIGQPLGFGWFNSEAEQFVWPLSSVYPLPVSSEPGQQKPGKKLYVLTGLIAVGEPKHSFQVWRRVRDDQ